MTTIASFYRALLLVILLALLAATLSACQNYVPLDKMTPDQQRDFYKGLDEA
jgi:hypothetical protein